MTDGTLIDSIFFGVFILNALINIYIISNNSKSKKKDNQPYSVNFWKGFIYFVPFFVTIKLIKGLEKKDQQKREWLSKNYDKIISIWKTAAEDLHIKIQVPYIIKNQKTEITYPILVENFGSKSGVILVLMKDDINVDLPKNLGFFCTCVHPSFYSYYNKNYIIDRLNTWGYFGDDINRPSWYSGKLGN